MWGIFIETDKLKLLGKGQILSHIKKSTNKTEVSIFIVGPWLDAYFTRVIISSLPHQDIGVRFLVRDVDGVIDGKTLSALNLARLNLRNFQARSLEKLHSKVIIIDDKIFYLGSANWYWYSLMENWETTITGNTGIIMDLTSKLESYWDIATLISEDVIKEHFDFKPVKKDHII